MLMNRIGRKKTVLLSLLVTAVSLILPITGDSYTTMLLSFSLLGIGNAIMQTSLNPLVSNLISPSRLASTLTFGQFVKAIASFLAPVIAARGATTYLPTFGLGWRALFVIYAVISLVSISALAATPIEEERSDKASGVGECLRLLGRPFILLCFPGHHVSRRYRRGHQHNRSQDHHGASRPAARRSRIRNERLFHLPYSRLLPRSFHTAFGVTETVFGISVVMMLAAMGMLFTCESLTMIYAALGLIGFGNSNIFSVIFSQALMASPDEKNEVSGLMIMGLFGGTVFPLAMGYAADATGQLAQWQ